MIQVRELGIWSAPQLLDVAAAEARFQSVLEDEAPVPLDGLEPRLQAFVGRVAEHAPQAEIVAVGRGGGGPLYSRSGIVVRFPNEITREVYPSVISSAMKLDLHTYDRFRKSVTGRSVDPDITTRST
ncbi:hypothetical protein [Glycomyces paridis]|uniref:Uncharacterized protein n=1 Tax=Glycomyces paridis TaxID=2126555 RepID=A0A4S8PNC7_9ACTN|nr:hypothetical protein [Glycomyces paridis]THV30129.1 hypothetical protein E9998_07055 [Glycomyces paridis]